MAIPMNVVCGPKMETMVMKSWLTTTLVAQLATLQIPMQMPRYSAGKISEPTTHGTVPRPGANASKYVHMRMKMVVEYIIGVGQAYSNAIASSACRDAVQLDDTFAEREIHDPPEESALKEDVVQYMHAGIHSEHV